MKKSYPFVIAAVLTAILTAVFYVRAAAPKQVYYSVGQNTSDHKTGSPTVTISNGTATFSVAQTASNMGVGDRVTYNDNRVAYISGKISPTQWTVVTKLGAQPSNVSNEQVNSIGHEFNSLATAVSFYKGNKVADEDHLDTRNLVAGNYVLNIPLYYDTGPEIVPSGGIEGTIQMVGFTTGSGNYVKIYTPNNTATEVNQSQRHNGQWDDQKYNIRFIADYNFTAAFRAYFPYVKVEGLQIKVVSSYLGNSGLEFSYMDGGWIEISNNIIAGEVLNFVYGIFAGYGDLTTTAVKVWNNLVYDLKGSAYGYSEGIYLRSNIGSSYVYNNTVINSQIGIHAEAGAVVAKNNIVQDALSGLDIGGYVGNFSGQSESNISNQNDAPGSNSKNSAAVSFVDKTGKDFHLTPNDTVAQDAGTDLSSDSNLAFSTDIDTQDHAPGSAWDIGADEIFVPPATAAISAFPGTIYSGESVNVSWGSTNASACLVTENGNSFASGTSGSQSAGPLTSDTTFEINCSGSGGSATNSATVTVLTSPVLTSVNLSSTNGASGVTSLNTELKADATYTGLVTDTVNYTFWWNCSDTSTDIPYLSQTSVCGDPTVPAYGEKYDNQAGGSFTTSKTTTTHIYSPGDYTAKVVVERGPAAAVEKRLGITVTNVPPSIDNVTITEPDYCTSGPGGFTSWAYSDPENDPQTAYQFQIDLNARSFNSPVYDSGQVSSDLATAVIPPGSLEFGAKYKARVRVWEAGGLSSGWVNQSVCNGPGCTGGGSWDTPKHAYPQYKPFTWSPTFPLANQPVQFFNQSICYDDSNSATACESWNYDFDYPSGTDSSNNPNPSHTFPAFGVYQVSEIAVDNKGYSCPSTPQPLNVNARRTVPIWRETSPK